ncbi:helix-turn-helix domain-containing protein [Streptomyces sp. NPDC047968]|uniref:helix-turn-helix domain-containing protein n=1 Tax=unclassified Streptomyces TaxID=2593676 RepID=UPI0034215805
MFMDTTAMASLWRLDLTPTATAVLSLMVDEQAPGGAVHLSQDEMAKKLSINRAHISKGMRMLVERGLVIRPNGGRGRRYALNPAIAGYESEEDFVQTMTTLLAAGGPPPIVVPDYKTAPPRRTSTRGLRSVA